MRIDARIGDCECSFFSAPNSRKVVVFLPSASDKDIYPYYPRLSWENDLSGKVNVLYINDPFQHLDAYKTPMGSWYISPSGDFVLPEVAVLLQDFLSGKGIDEVLYYGSSMGGYAAVVLASLHPGAKAIAECPQLFLSGHPGSRYVYENFLRKTIDVETVEPLSFVRKSVGSQIRIFCSVQDYHYKVHVLPFAEKVSACQESEHVDIEFIGYKKPGYKSGHVALSKADALPLICTALKI
ncbi:pimeloyl-ACP methyl ester carboxylesterase [Pseudomonas nitritireducens]|uniref:Pimeloyl-ACP methyl ester carboxylesterase n=1 Tax=Pseudomonas nitroreducens TaxID=46680 RepID=A0A7W7P1R3_PSENT|nr:alpha/beta hydrolase [Pseudomonas nitritireducens]MBB4865103.1 pimeloyl-ACP methyl ester carboxylesterase [Pseudomonas nitritireducens]